MSAAGRLGWVTDCKRLPNGRVAGIVYIDNRPRLQTAPAPTTEEISVAVRQLAERLEQQRGVKAEPLDKKLERMRHEQRTANI